MPFTKIVATIGPASNDPTILRKMIGDGLSCARINIAHGELTQYKSIVSNIRKISKMIPILIDVKGPEMRFRTPQTLDVKQGDELTISFSPKEKHHFNKDFHKFVHKGDTIYFKDGVMRGTIMLVNAKALRLRLDATGKIKDSHGVNVPGMITDWPILTDHDKEMLTWGIKADLDFVALSFVRNAKDIAIARAFLGKSTMKIIAKIENISAVEHLDEIILVSDGVMVARGDLGVELPPEKVPLIQKEIIRKCIIAGKPVITATQMLESMVNNPIATRAETSDAANAILDGTDAVMLSEETAMGSYPNNAVRVLSTIAREVEPHVNIDIPLKESMTISDAIARSIHQISLVHQVDHIVSMTRSGYTARMISRFRMNTPIIALTHNPTIARQLNLSFGVTPYMSKHDIRNRRLYDYIKDIIKMKIIGKDEVVVFTAGKYTTHPNTSNMILMHKMGDLMKYCN